jgi:hypothetical protein
MKSSVSGKSISTAEVTNISINGIWLLFNKREYFLPFADFPWFRNARISELHNVKVLHGDHLYWPDLDIDLTAEIIGNVESYPLVYK